MSNGISFKKKITTTASLVVAVAGGVLAPAVLAAPAHASISFCCNASTWQVSSTDPSIVNAVFDNYQGGDRQVILTYTKGGATTNTQVVPLPPALSQDSIASNGVITWGQPSKTPVTIKVEAGVTVTATATNVGETLTLGTYTNKAAPAPVVVKPPQVGNVITIPDNQNGAVQYLPMGGAAKPLPAGYQWTLTAGQTAAIGEFTTDGSHTLLGSWTYAYVAPAPAQLTPQLPTHVSGNLWKVPAVSGYHFEINGTTIPAGDYYVPAGGVTVVAVSDSAQLQLVGKTSEVLPYATPPVTPPETRLIWAKLGATVPQGSVSTGAEFVITGIDDPAQAPASIIVVTDGGSYEVPLTKVTGKTAHYIVTFTTQGQTITSASTKIYAGWDGQFNLSHYLTTQVSVPTPPPGDTGDHGGNTGGNTGDTGNHGGNTGGNTGNTGGNGGDTTTPGSTTTSGGTTNTTPSSTLNVTVQTPTQPAANNQAVEQNTTQPAATGYQAKVDTAIGTDTASATDPASIAWLVGAAGVIGLILVRRPKHRKEA